MPLYEDGVSVSLLVKKDIFKVLDYGWELLRNTPDHSKSITWVVLETKKEHKIFGICNTHFLWMQQTIHLFMWTWNCNSSSSRY